MIAMAVKERIRRANVKRMRRRILRQIIRIFRGKEVEREYLTFLSMALTMPNVLSDYDKALEEIRDEIKNGNFYVVDFDERTRVWMRLHDTVEKPDETVEAKSRVRMILRPKRSAMKPLHKAIASYCFERQIEYTASTITSLTNAYRKKDEILQTYYAAFLRKYGYLRYSAPPMLIANMKDLVEDGGVFACEHVLQAIYTSKDEKLVFDMLKVLDRKESFVHPKIVSDGLLAFQGNAEALQVLLLEHRKEFSIDMQVNILTYLRFASGAHCEKIFDILDNRKENDEMLHLLLKGTYNGVSVLNEYVDAWNKWNERSDENARIAKDIDTVQAIYQFLVYYNRTPSKFSDERVINWLKETREIFTDIGRRILTELVLKNPDFAATLKQFESQY
jgi:disulfide oxidoreductase YuzD